MLPRHVAAVLRVLANAVRLGGVLECKTDKKILQKLTPFGTMLVPATTAVCQTANLIPAPVRALGDCADFAKWIVNHR